MPLVHSVQSEHLSCVETNTISKWTNTTFHLTHVTLEYHRVCPKWFLSLWYVRHKPCTSKMIFEPTIHLVQTVHLSYVKINTISKRIQMSFHMTHVTKEYLWVCPKRFQSLWYVQHKLCTYLASRLTLSPNWPKWASTWPTSTRTTVRCAQKDFHVCDTFDTNRAPVLHQDQHYLQNRPKRASTWPTSRRSSIGCVQNDFRA
jgi:hypothetical protein